MANNNGEIFQLIKMETNVPIKQILELLSLESYRLSQNPSYGIEDL